MIDPRTAVKRPIVTLSILFCAWKLLLLLILTLASGPAYDTSSELAAGVNAPTVLTRLTKWDAIFFTSIAQRGYLYEQEWAFGYGYARLVGLVAGVLRLATGASTDDISVETIAAVLLSHTSHYASVLLLWRVTSQVFRSGAKIAFLTALLHIFSPGGIFLSAPYAESLFSFLSFAALAAYYRGVSTEKAADQAFVVLSGLLFGIACTVRSNGLFYGILFIPSLSQLRGGLQNIAAPAALICGGGLVAIGAISAQVLAYIEFCYMVPMSERAVWCANTIPSIYTYVQERYWQVGLFSYWKKANIPLFFLSSPLIAVLLMSGFRFSQDGGTLGQLHVQSRARGMLRRLGTIQLVLALLAISMYHIQIVMRIASGYPVWYWWLAEKLSGRAGVGSPKSDLMIWASRTIVAYGVIQAGLFATFLPPA